MTDEMDRGLTPRSLRWLSDGYETSQRLRIETGERIRAVLQGRDETFEASPEWASVVELVSQPDMVWHDLGGDSARADELIAWADEIAEREAPGPNEEVLLKAQKKAAGEYAAQVLREIAKGDTPGPVPILGRTYRRHAEEEGDLKKNMMEALQGHPAFPWLEQVRGIGPTLACKILARLDVHKAPHASSFFAYCGLATVPGEKYRCETCGLVRGWPAGYKVTGVHLALGTQKSCSGSLEKVAGPEDGIRAAQPKPVKGKEASYDQYAKKIMYLVGTSFLKAGGPFERFYRKKRAMLERERQGWADGRKHLTALRATEKLFLGCLWAVWREAEGLPVTDPYPIAELGHKNPVDPWDMVEDGRGEQAA